MREFPDLMREVRRLREEINALKQLQWIGRDSLMTYRTSSGNQYDITTTLSVGEIKQFRVTLMYDVAVGGAVFDFNAFYRLDDPDVMADPMPRVTPFNPHVIVTWRRDEITPTYTSWIVEISNITFVLTPVPYVKLFIDGTATGSMGIVQI